jgi:hypothetical protein
MSATSGENGSEDVGPARGGPSRVVARMLAERGLDVRCLDEEDCPLLLVTGEGRGKCDIDAEDGEGIVWQYFPSGESAARPVEISGVVLRVLGRDGMSAAWPGTRVARGETLKGAVARVVRAQGLKAELKVYQDLVAWDIAAVEVVLTNPGMPERGLVRLTDDGMVRWEPGWGEMQQDAAEVVGATVDVLAAPRDRRSAVAGQCGGGEG